MRAFGRQLAWELRRLWRRPRSRLGFLVCVALEVVVLGLFELPVVRDAVVREVWRVDLPIDRAAAFGGIALAVHVLGETMIYGIALFVALVAGDIVAKEIEDGTIRLVLARPVSRTSIFVQKLVACAAYAATLVAFAAVVALVLGVVVEGRGGFLILVPRDNLFGMLDFETALARYALAVPVAALAMFTVALLAFALSCFRVKPGTATVLALAVLFADWMVRNHPSFLAIAPYCLTTRLATWRQVFNTEIPWLRMERNLGQLLWIDAALVVIAWRAWLRREIAAR